MSHNPSNVNNLEFRLHFFVHLYLFHLHLLYLSSIFSFNIWFTLPSTHIIFSVEIIWVEKVRSNQLLSSAHHNLRSSLRLCNKKVSSRKLTEKPTTTGLECHLKLCLYWVVYAENNLFVVEKLHVKSGENLVLTRTMLHSLCTIQKIKSFKLFWFTCRTSTVISTVMSLLHDQAHDYSFTIIKQL